MRSRFLFLFAALVTARSSNDVLFGLGTAFDGRDFSITVHGDRVAILFSGSCHALYAIRKPGFTRVIDSKCAPTCFKAGFSFVIEGGIIFIQPSGYGCESESARVKTARWVDEATVHLLRDTDTIYFDTFAI